MAILLIIRWWLEKRAVPKPVSTDTEKMLENPIPQIFSPPYLFYLPDRDKQTVKLCLAIKEHEQTTTKQRPLVCLVSGESQESHDKFKDCFVGKTLPKLYSWISSENDVQCLELTMGNCNQNRAELQKDIFNKLIKKLPHFPAEENKAGVTKLLAGGGKPVIFYIDILVEDCKPVNDIIEKGFIEFWRDWPEPQDDWFINQQDKQNYRLLVFMCFRYPDTTKTWLKFSNPLSIRRKVTQQLAHLDENLSKSIYWFQVGAVVLPQLESIKKETAIEWLRDDCKKKFNFRYDTLQTIEAKIRQFYQGHSNGIPMEILASKLQEILQETIR